MPKKPIKMIGKKYGCLLVLGEDIRSDAKNKIFRVKCTFCQGVFPMYGGNIRRHAKSSQGGCKHCFKYNKKHGLWDNQAYGTWEGMVRRCHNEKHESYKRYGGRGIIVCTEWRENPTEFINWLYSNGWEEGLQIDRKDNDKGYEPDNCRIVSRRTNMNNKSNNRHVVVGGRKVTIAIASRMTGINKTTIKERLNRGWSVYEAATVAVGGVR